MSEPIELEGLLTEGKITRRDFLARLSALGISAALSPALISASAKAATPKKGGRFRIGMAGGSTTDSLDPATITDAITGQKLGSQRRCQQLEIQAAPRRGISQREIPGSR
jgi:peptide/nickel transport system substrate-binding protein